MIRLRCVIGLVAALTSGCAATSANTNGRIAVLVADYGFTQGSPDRIGNSYISYAAVVRNPNSSAIADQVAVNLSFYSATGVVVASKSETIPFILPGQSMAVGRDLRGVGATRLDVQALAGHWESATATTVGTFTVTGVSVSHLPYNGLNVTGQIASTFARDFKQLKAVAVLRDAAHKIVGGAFTSFYFLSAHGNTGLEVNSLTDVPAATMADVLVGIADPSLG